MLEEGLAKVILWSSFLRSSIRDDSQKVTQPLVQVGLLPPQWLISYSFSALLPVAELSPHPSMRTVAVLFLMFI